MADAAQHGGRTRRTLLRTVFGLGMAGGTAAALAPLARAGRTPEPGAYAAPAPGPAAQAAPGRVTEETYRGRHIQVRHAPKEAPVEAAALPSGPYPATPSHDVLIDGRPLPVMRRADGSYMTTVNHYESFPTLTAAARAAVDDLRGAQLALDDPMLHHA
ncbi:tyrosinase family oxidase copper chaperone [Streptomyces tremellae]|uniref:Tyrosinase n=1 Tax=Streptomyces tremellae TaxID=1124239 RepID=A0ABP7E3G0_9ACTN